MEVFIVQIEINITPMSLRNGVMGLPISCCRDWNAMKSVSAIFIYAGRESNITFTAKHINKETKRASAWQFTINDSVQFATLKMDGVYTYAEGELSDEKLICDLSKEGDKYILNVINKFIQPATNATTKIRELLMQGIRPISSKVSSAPVWNEPSAWIDFEEIERYNDVTDCLYMWCGKNDKDNTIYLYVGIVGDTKSNGKSKRSLAKRLKEEEKKFSIENNVSIVKFRFCSLNNAHGFSIQHLLKTVEMSQITIMTSLFSCENARHNIDALLGDVDVILLNKSTSYKYIK